MIARQLATGVPGSFPLPNPGNAGTAYVANKMHPAALGNTALAQPRLNPVNARPGLTAPGAAQGSGNGGGGGSK